MIYFVTNVTNESSDIPIVRMSQRGYRENVRITDYERDNRRLLEKLEKLEVEDIPIERIRLDEEALQFEEKDTVEILADSYKRRKRVLNYPILQRSTLRVISGTHRVLAAKKNGMKSLLCRLVSVEEDEAWAIRIEENLTRRKTKAAELYYWMKKARDEWGYTQDVMSSLVGLSPGRVSGILKWGDGGMKGPSSNTPIKSKPTEESSLSKPLAVDEGPMSVPEIPLTHPPTPESMTLEVELPAEAQLPEAPIRPVWEWDVGMARNARGTVNGYVRYAAKMLTTYPDFKVHLESMYEYIGQVLGYDR